MNDENILNGQGQSLAELKARLAKLDAEEKKLTLAGQDVPDGMYLALASLYFEVHAMNARKEPLPFAALKATFKADKDWQQIKPFGVHPYSPQEVQAGHEPICPGCGEPCNHTPQEMQGFAYDASAQAIESLWASCMQMPENN